MKWLNELTFLMVEKVWVIGSICLKCGNYEETFV